MNLDGALSLDDLKGLAADLAMLVKVGTLMENAGLAPRFSVTPSGPVVINTGLVLFTAPERLSMADIAQALMPKPLTSDELFQRRVRERGAQRGCEAQSPASSSGLSGETGFPAPPPLAAPEPATLYAPAGTPEQPDAIRQAMQDAMAGGLGAVRIAPEDFCAAPAPEPEPDVPVAARAGASWTDAEDEELVEALARNRVSGNRTQKAVLFDCAVRLNRTERSVELRFQNRLRFRVERRVAELDRQGAAAPQPDQAAPAGPESDANSPAEQDAGHQDPEVPAGDATGAAPPPAAPVDPEDEVQRAVAWLQTVKRDDVWTLQKDFDVMHLVVLGWSADDIALECKVPVQEVKPRFERLTQQRTLPRATVLDALARMLAQG